MEQGRGRDTVGARYERQNKTRSEFDQEREAPRGRLYLWEDLQTGGDWGCDPPVTLLYRYRCPWCVVVERGVKASALMRKHILERHRALLIRGLGLLETFATRKEAIAP